MNIAGHELPDECPKDCPFTEDIARYGQNAICGRCPLFVCRTDEGEDGVIPALVEPEDYRPDWAAVWSAWFSTGMKGYPDLRFEVPE